MLTPGKSENIRTLKYSHSQRKHSSNTSEQWFLNFNIHLRHLEVLLKPSLLDPTPEFLIQ